jgi:hypothetical protein
MGAERDDAQLAVARRDGGGGGFLGLSMNRCGLRIPRHPSARKAKRDQQDGCE